MRSAINRKTPYIQDLFATAYDTDIWSEVIVGTGVVSISSGELKLDCPAFNDVAGLVTKIPYYVRNARIQVAVDLATDDGARAGIIIGKTKVTATTPEAIQDCLRLTLDNVNNKVLCITDVAGVEKTVLNAAWTDADGTLQIDIEPDGFTALFEDSTEKQAVSLPLTGTATQDIFKLYIYIYNIAGAAANNGYALLDNFQLDLDLAPTGKVAHASTVRAANAMASTPIIGRIVDFDGTADTFEADDGIDTLPTRRVVLSRDAQKFKLEEVRYYVDATNAVTSELLLFEHAEADNVRARTHRVFSSGAAVVDAKPYIAVGTKMSDGAATQTHSTPLPVTMNLERAGQVWFNIDWNGAPADTKGYIELVGKEVM